MTARKSGLITGATGFIGSALARRLVDEGIRVYCLVRKREDESSSIHTFPGAEWVETESFQPPQLQKTLSNITADVVFNLASFGVNPRDCDPELMIEGNMGILTGLLAATREWSLDQFVHTGSCSEYGEPQRQELLTEDHPIRPTTLYGAAKAATVLYGNALAAKFNIPFVTLRLFGVYGTGEGPHRLIPYVIHLLRRDEPVDLTTGEQVRDFLYIDDAVEAFFRAGYDPCPEPRQVYQVYHVCSGIPMRVRDAGETVARVMGKPLNLLQWGKRSFRPGEPMWMVGNNSKFTEATGWRPRIDLLEGITRMLSASGRTA